MSRRVVASLVVLAVIAAVAVSAWVAWDRYTATPHYATTKALQAMSDRDWESFQRWVDVGSVVKVAVKEQAGGQPVPSGFESQARDLLRQRVTGGIRGVPENVPFLALVFSGVVHDAVATGSTATAVISADSGGRSVRMDLKLRRIGGSWRVVEVSNASDLLRQGL
jgi:hypothetical protein